jgi:alpha-galactosidase
MPYSKAEEMLLSLSPGPAPVAQADHLKQYADLWRISNDLWDHWDFIPRQINYCRQWYPYITPGRWPDIDMLPLGKLRVTGGDEWIASLLYDDFENIGNEFTRFTRDEQVTLMNLMAIFRSPLMMGGNLLDNDEWTLSLLTNKNMIYVNQHSTNNREVEFGDDWSYGPQTTEIQMIFLWYYLIFLKKSGSFPFRQKNWD